MNISRNGFIGLIGALVLLGFVAIWLWLHPQTATAQTPPPMRQANAVPLNTEVEYAHTYVCALPGNVRVRNWDFTDRWLPNQLSYDRYTAVNADGNTKVYVALAKNPSLKPKHVRFSERKINVGDGPGLEGFQYRRTLINGKQAQVERVVLFVEYNGALEPQSFAPPPCGTPRQ